MNRRKRIINICLCLIMLMSCLYDIKLQSKAATVTKKELLVSGTVSILINESGDNNSSRVTKVLRNFPIKICYENVNNKTYRKKCTTDNNGQYIYKIESTIEVRKVWIEVSSSNDACTVKVNKKKKTGPYDFRQLNPVYVSKGSTTITDNYQISGNDAGALNIANLINQARDYLNKEFSYKVPFVNVVWDITKNNGSNANNSTGLINIAGSDRDDRDDSVIVHEYGHWAFGQTRQIYFMGGKHCLGRKSNKLIAFSEGLATFFSQSFLNKVDYKDLSPNGSGIIDNLENTNHSSSFEKFGQSNEQNVYCAMWDMIDAYGRNETWDQLSDSKHDVLESIFKTVLEADTTLKYRDKNFWYCLDCTMNDFYNIYAKEYKNNSQGVFDLWNLFSNNHMKFDNKKPSITVDTVKTNTSSVTIGISDNVKVAKVDVYFNKNLLGSVSNPKATETFSIPKKHLKNGTNMLVIKAFDYQGLEKYNSYLSTKKKKAMLSKLCTTKYYYIQNGFYYKVHPLSFEETENIDNNNESEMTNYVKYNSMILRSEKIESIKKGESTKTNKLFITPGNDTAFLFDDLMGNYRITLTDPQGNTYRNEILEDYQEDTEVDDESDSNVDNSQVVSNLETLGLYVKNPIPGEWTYTIENLDENQNEVSECYMGIYTKLSAPKIENAEELTHIQDEGSITVKGSFDYPKKENKSDADVLTQQPSISEVVMNVYDEEDNLVKEIRTSSINHNGEFKLNLTNLPDGIYKLEVFSKDQDGSISSTNQYDLIKDCVKPEIEIEDDYSFYRYYDTASLSGIALNANDVIVSVNGENVEVMLDSKKENEVAFEFDAPVRQGTNHVVVTAISKSGKITTTEFDIEGITEAEYTNEANIPQIDKVTFDGSEELVIGSDTKVRVTLTDYNTDNYKVYTVINDEVYQFMPSDGGYVLDLEGFKIGEGEYEFSVYVKSRTEDFIKENYQVIVGENGLLVTLEPNGGELKEVTYHAIIGKTYGKLPIPTKKGYKFLGWYTSMEDGTLILEDTIASKEDALTLYAHWKKEDKEKNIKVTFHKNDSYEEDHILDEEKLVALEDMYGTLPTVNRDQYKFAGWFTDEIGGELITETSIVTNEKDHDLYAHWKIAKSTINFDPVGGTVSPKSKEFNPSVKLGTLPYPFKTGYLFSGWYTKKEGGEQITEETILPKSDQSITVYARWILQDGIIVNLNPCGGTLSESYIIVPKGSSYETLPTPKRDGYSFLGWFDGDTKVTKDMIMNHTETFTLNARYQSNNCTRIFDLNGGQINNSSDNIEQSYPYEEAYKTLPQPVKKGYRFLGWYTLKSGGVEVNTEDIVKDLETITYYAHWESVKYTITFDSKGGTLDITTKNKGYMEEYGTMPIPIREHYTFLGWSKDDTSISIVTATDKVTEARNHTLYALWKGESYVVTYDVNGGSKLDVSKKSIVYGDKYGELPKPSRKGYHFLYWTTDSEGEQKISETSRVVVGGNHTLYAQWQKDKVLVEFDPAGGELADDATSKTCEYDEKYGQLPSAKKVGYELIGWYTKEGELIKNTSIVKADGKQVLYARWRAATYKILLDTNGGELNSYVAYVTYNSTYERLPVPTKPGYKFIGWKFENGERITSNTKVTITSGITIYAEWETGSYTVSFDTNGGNPITSTIQVKYQGMYGALPTPTKAGYQFLGWTDIASETIDSYITANSKVTIGKDHVLYAVWGDKAYKTIFNMNGGTYNNNTTYEANFIYGSTYGELIIPTKPGYMFDGWYTSQNGGDKITSSSVVKNTTTQNLYAHWKEMTYNIKFNMNGGSRYSDILEYPKTVTYNSTYGDLPDVFHYDSYEFLGWYTKPIGGEKIEENTRVNITSDQTLYAHWKGNDKRISIALPDGTYMEKDVRIGEKIGELPTPLVQENKKFIGWFTSENGGQQITSETIFTNDLVDMIIYPRWEDIPFAVFLDPMGGSVSYTSINVTKNTYLGTLPTPAKVGYKFTGWYTYEGELITESMYVTFDHSITLYAHWDAVIEQPDDPDPIENKVLVRFYAPSAKLNEHTRYVIKGEPIGELPEPILDGQQFIGWYTSDGIKVTKDTIVTESITLNASYSSGPHTIYFVTRNSKVTIDPRIVEGGSTYGELPNLPNNEEGKKFLYWYKINDDNKTITIVTPDMTVPKGKFSYIYALYQ